MDTTQPAQEIQPASSAKLSLEISELVSRALAGEAIDMPAEGQRLAGRYPDLGMSGEMIGSAIERALGMVGATRGGAETDGPDADADAGEHAEGLGEPEAADLATVIAAVDSAILVPTETGVDPAGPADRLDAAAPHPESGSGVLARFSRGSVAAVRRAFFRG